MIKIGDAFVDDRIRSSMEGSLEGDADSKKQDGDSSVGTEVAQ